MSEAASVGQILAEIQRKAVLPVTDREHPDGFALDEQGIDIHWGGHLYQVHWNRLRTPADLLHWVAHLSEKTWIAMTPRRISRLIRAVSARRGWPLE